VVKLDIVFSKNNETILKMNVEGHAGFDSKGLDIVCSAISVLVWTFIESVASIPGIKYSLSDAEVLHFTLLDSPETEVCLVKGFSVFLLKGLSGIEKNYKNKNLQ